MSSIHLPSTKPRTAFLLALALGISLLFLWLIHGFLLALLLAAILAGLSHPVYLRIARFLRGNRVVAAITTVGLSLVLVIVPLTLFLGLLVAQGLEVSDSAKDWVTSQAELKETLNEKIAEDPHLKQLLPYQDQIVAKLGLLASEAGSYMARGLAAGARGTAQFFLMLFILLFSTFYFLLDGRAFLDQVFRFTPLADHDKTRLLGTFSSVGRATIKGVVIIGLVQGFLAGLAFWFAGIESAVFWGAVMVVLSVIPGIGAPLIWVPAVAYLVLNGQVVAAVSVGVWCALVVSSVDNLLRPVLVGKDTKMPDLLVLLTTLGGLAWLGAAGIIVGPVIGALFMTVWQLWSSAVERSDEAPTPTRTSPKGEANDHA